LFYAHYILSGGEFESLGKLMVDCIFEMSLSEPMLLFKQMSGSIPHFPTVRFYQFIWLYSIPCTCMMCSVVLFGVIKFDGKLMVIYYFRNIHLLLISKCLLHYLGLSLIDILACDVL